MTRRASPLPVVSLDRGGIPVGESLTPTGRVALRLPLTAPRGPAVVVVGGLHIAALIANRAAASGARVAVETARPERWRDIARASVRVLAPGVPRPGRGSADEPVLLVRDLGARPPSRPSGTEPWITTVTLLPFIDPPASAVLRTGEVVGLQRLSPPESDTAARALGLSRADRELLPRLPDAETLWCAAGHTRRAECVVDQAEAGLLGPPRRVD